MIRTCNIHFHLYSISCSLNFIFAWSLASSNGFTWAIYWTLLFCSCIVVSFSSYIVEMISSSFFSVWILLMISSGMFQVFRSTFIYWRNIASYSEHVRPSLHTLEQNWVFLPSGSYNSIVTMLLTCPQWPYLLFLQIPDSGCVFVYHVLFLNLLTLNKALPLQSEQTLWPCHSAAYWERQIYSIWPAYGKQIQVLT